MGRSNRELARLHKADQADRKGAIDWSTLRPRDAERRRRVTELIEAGALATGADHFHAAMVFQHGDGLDDFWRAHELARAAVELGHERARSLVAKSYDRWLMHQGRPQKYSTQYQGVNGRWTLYTVDPATTDDQRAGWNIPT